VYSALKSLTPSVNAPEHFLWKIANPTHLTKLKIKNRDLEGAISRGLFPPLLEWPSSSYECPPLVPASDFVGFFG